MQTTIPGKDLHSLDTTLQYLLEDSPLGIHCVFREGRLIVLGQHSADIAVDSKQMLRILERKIQSLQLQFAQQVLLYLRIFGEKHPYAHRRFVIQPPPPPPNPVLCQARGQSGNAVQSIPQDEWLVGDEELDTLLSQLIPSANLIALNPFVDAGTPLDAVPLVETASGSDIDIPCDPPIDPQRDPHTDPERDPQRDSHSDPHTDPQHSSDTGVGLVPYGAIQTLAPLARSTQVHWITKLHRKAVWTTGTAVLGLAGGAYVLTRPCSLATCPQIQNAQTLSQESIETVQAATTKGDLELAQQHLTQAVTLLETIPIWSSQGHNAKVLIQTYQEQAIALEHIIHAENQAAVALERIQNAPHSVEEWQEIQTLLQEAIAQLDNIQPENEVYEFVQERSQTYQASLTEVEYQRQLEQNAQHALNNVKQTVELAEARQKIAQSLANWQLVRATWQVVMMRLDEISDQTLAAESARTLKAAYQPQLDAANRRVEQEQNTERILQQADQQAVRAKAAEQRYDWQQAVLGWSAAIAYMQQVPQGTSQRVAVESRITTYKTARDAAQQRLDATDKVAAELAKVCTGELQICTLLSVNSSIQVQLAGSYVDAIAAARETGNRNLQAIVAEHQLNLRKTLEKIAADFQLPVEVYNPDNVMLDRHLPR